MKKVCSFIVGLVTLCLFPMISWTLDIFANAPECCGGEADFTGYQSSLFGTVFFYQCQVCKKTFVVHREQRSFSLHHLWMLLFMPKMGEVRGENVSLD